MKKIIASLMALSFPIYAEVTPGITEPYDIIKVTSEINGVISAYNKDIGEKVNENEILIKIEDEIIKIEKELAETQIKQIQTEIDYYNKKAKSYKNLFQQKNMSEFDYDDVFFQLELSKNKMKQQKLELDKKVKAYEDTTLYGRDGYIVSKRNIEVGQYVQMATELYEIVDIRKLKISILASEKIIDHFNVGDEVNVIVDDKKIIGKVLHKGISMKENSYAYPVIVEIDNNDLRIPISKTLFVEYGEE